MHFLKSRAGGSSIGQKLGKWHINACMMDNGDPKKKVLPVCIPCLKNTHDSELHRYEKDAEHFRRRYLIFRESAIQQLVLHVRCSARRDYSPAVSGPLLRLTVVCGGEKLGVIVKSRFSLL